MKFIFTTDWHLKSVPSSTIKIDNFTQILLDRVQVLLNQQVDFIVHGGDLFDSPNIDDLNFFNEVLLLFRNNSIPFYIVPGQHDLQGYEPSSLKWSCLKLLENVGYIKILQPGLNVINNTNFYVVYPSKKHSLDMYRDIKNSIIVSHNLISPVSLPYEHILTDTISTVIDQCLVLSGDLHMSFEKIYENSAFLNPGPLMRMSKTEVVSNGFFEILFSSTDFSCSYKKINFPSVDVQIDSNIEVEEFTNKLNLTITSDYVSLEELIEQVSKKLYKDKKVTEEALKWIRFKQ